MAGPRVSVEITGDSRGLKNAFDDAGRATDGFGSSLVKVGKIAVAAAGVAGIAGLAIVLKTGISEFMEASKVAAQTGAVLKSTGGIANVTAKDIDSLAESLMRKSGVDDEAIQSGANLLLTFTKVRNEAGKGNDVFNQATKATLDLSVAMGKDMTSSAILVGKALNDPIKGMASLSRAGVQFTDEQKTMIKAMVESGNVMGAQKVILKELETQFGGSAEAAGKTLPGQLKILKESFSNLSGELVSGMMPALTKVAGELLNFVEHFQNADGASAKFRVVLDNLSDAFAKLWGELVKAVPELGVLESAFKTVSGAAQDTVKWLKEHQTVMAFLVPIVGGLATAVVAMAVAMKVAAVASAAWAAAQAILNVVMAANPIVLVVVALVALGAALVIAYQRSETFRNIVNGAFSAVKSVVLPIIAAITTAWNQWGDDIMRVVNAAFRTLSQVIGGYLNAVRAVVTGVMALLRGDWSKAWDSLKTVVSSVFSAMTAVIRNFGPILGAAAIAVGMAIIKGVLAGLEGIANDVKGKLQAVAQAVVGMASQLYGNALGAGKRLMQGLIDGIGSMAGAVLGKLQGWKDKAIGILTFDWGSDVGQFGGTIGSRLMTGLADGITTKGQASLSALRKVKLDIIADMNDLNRQLAADAARRATEDLQRAVADANARVAAAKKGTADYAQAIRDRDRAVEDVENAGRQKQLTKHQAHLDALQQKIDSYKEKFAASWGKLSDAALSAWDKRYAAMQTSAEKELALIERTEAEKSRQQELAAAKAELSQATTDEARLSAQERVRKAELAIRVAALQDQAAAERTGLDALNETQRTAFEKRLAALKVSLEKQGATQKEAHAAIQKLYASFGLDYYNAGAKMGQSLVDGLASKVAAANKLKADLASLNPSGAPVMLAPTIPLTDAEIAALNATTTPPPSYSTQQIPSDNLYSVSAPIVVAPNYSGLGQPTLGSNPRGFAKGGLVKGGRGGIFARIGEGKHDELVTPLRGNQGVGGGNITIHLPNYMGDKRDMVELIRSELIRTGRSMPQVLGGLA